MEGKEKELHVLVKVVLSVTRAICGNLGDGEEKAVECDEAKAIIDRDGTVERIALVVIGQSDASSCYLPLLSLQNGKEEMQGSGVIRNRGIFEPRYIV